MPVTIWTFKEEANRGVDSYLVRMLKQLGYRASLHRVPMDKFYAAVVKPSRKIQLGLTGWIGNIPAASDYFLPVLTCRSTFNLAQFCDPRTDKLAREAQAALQTDPAAGRGLWGQVDRVVTGQAPWVPVLNQSGIWFVSARVRNCQESPYYAGPLFDQAWVR